MSSKLNQNRQDKSQFSGVILWSMPRSRSTAFERSIRELKDVSVLHETHQFAFYFGPERIYPHTVYREDGSVRTEPAATFEAARAEIISEAELCRKTGQRLFIKDMPCYLDGNYTAYTQGGFEHFKQTFLIRHPLKVAHSWNKAMQALDWHFEPYELGFEQIYNLYMTLKCTIDPAPLVIDSDDLVLHPREMMKTYCSATCLPFSEEMLTWEPGLFPKWKEDPCYQIWLGEVMTSSGFKKFSPSSSPTLKVKDLPCDLQEAVKHALPFYEKLHTVRTLPS